MKLCNSASFVTMRVRVSFEHSYWPFFATEKKIFRTKTDDGSAPHLATEWPGSSLADTLHAFKTKKSCRCDGGMAAAVGDAPPPAADDGAEASLPAGFASYAEIKDALTLESKTNAPSKRLRNISSAFTTATDLILSHRIITCCHS